MLKRSYPECKEDELLKIKLSVFLLTFCYRFKDSRFLPFFQFCSFLLVFISEIITSYHIIDSSCLDKDVAVFPAPQKLTWRARSLSEPTIARTMKINARVSRKLAFPFKADPGTSALSSFYLHNYTHKCFKVGPAGSIL